MSPTEYTTRLGAAAKRLQEADPYTLLILTGLQFVGWAFRWGVYLCVGFGTVSMAALSAWWGFPAALVVALTFGRVWTWWRRDAVVKAYEEAAVRAERGAA